MHTMKRLVEALIAEYLTIFPAVALLGPRQCGKTTLLGSLPATWTRFDLEKDADYRAIARDPALFLRLHPQKAAFDEAQLLPPLFSALRVEIDRERAQKGRFVVTGSSSPALVRAISESLAGRVGIIEMAPFTASEALAIPTSPFANSLRAREVTPEMLSQSFPPRFGVGDLHRYWLQGGYPEPWLAKSERFRKVWAEQYVKTYVERDVARLFPGLNRERFRAFVRMLAGLSGSIINYADVARALNVSQPTAKDYFEIAHGSFLWRTLPAFDKRTLKRLVRHPRGYLRDSGLLHHLLRIPDQQSLLSHPAGGSSWEGMVIENILRGLEGSGVAYEASYYRTGGGAEIDLVLEGDFGLIPIEIKRTQSIASRDLRALTDFIREWKCACGIVINNDEVCRRLSDDIVSIPFASL
ncbi:MAG: ATP-binding protein [Polyangiaceae bacterium]|nr:ATP-binding protein [Polyangiaceae bacterium]